MCSLHVVCVHMSVNVCSGVCVCVCHVCVSVCVSVNPTTKYYVYTVICLFFRVKIQYQSRTR